MAYSDYFIGVYRYSSQGFGSLQKIPNKYISLQSFVSTPNQRQDLDSYQDAKGYLHRNTLEHYRSKVEFNTPPLLESDLQSLQTIINNGMISTKERKIKISFYEFDNHRYWDATVYVPDITFTPLRIVKINGSKKVLMDKVRMAFIEY